MEIWNHLGGQLSFCPIPIPISEELARIALIFNIFASVAEKIQKNNGVDDAHALSSMCTNTEDSFSVSICCLI